MASWKACFFAHCLNTVGTDLLPAKQAANRKMAFTGPWFSHSLRLYTMKNSSLLRFCGHPWECGASISFCPKKRTLQWRLSETGWDTLLLLLPNLQVRLELTSAANTIRSITRLGSVEVENYLGFNSLSDTLSYSCFICLVWNAESVAVINGCTDLMIWWRHILFFFFKKKKSKVVYSVENEMKQFASEFAHSAFPSAKSMFLSPTGGTLAHPCCPLSPLSQLSKTFPSIPFFYFRLFFSFLSQIHIYLLSTVQPRISFTQFSSHCQLSSLPSDSYTGPNPHREIRWQTCFFFSLLNVILSQSGGTLFIFSPTCFLCKAPPTPPPIHFSALQFSEVAFWHYHQ